MKFIPFFCIIILSLYCISCSTQYKIPYYLENGSDTAIKKEVSFPELRIQKNDELSIQVYDNSNNPEISSKLYNLPAVTGSSAASTAAGGYLVDANGNIEYPRIGIIHAEGLTKKELADTIKNKFSRELTNPVVVIRCVNFKIVVLGEVVNQGVISGKGEKMTILEAIGQAGGLTDYGNRNNIKVVREAAGKREIGVIDLASGDLFASPYFNLVQNDVVLIDPTRQKAKVTDQNRVVQQVSFALSVITAAAFIYNIFK